MDELTIVPASLNQGTFIVLTVLSFFTSMMTASLGIGGGSIMLATMAQFLPAHAIIPVHGIVQLGSNSGRAMIMLKHIRKQPLFWFVIGSSIGAAAGGAIVVDVPAPILKIVLGGFILYSIWMPKLVSSTPTNKAMFSVGAFSTLLTMFVGATGPFVIATLRTFGFSPTTLVATSAAALVIQHALKVLVFGLLGFAFADYAVMIVLMVAIGFLGTLVGRKVLLKLNPTSFQRGLNVVLAVLAIRLIYTGLTPT